MQLFIFGPNLSGDAQMRGDMHVHAADCNDCKRYGFGKQYGGDDLEPIAMTSDTRREVVELVYEDIIDEGGDYESCAASMYFAPCTKQLK